MIQSMNTKSDSYVSPLLSSLARTWAPGRTRPAVSMPACLPKATVQRKNSKKLSPQWLRVLLLAAGLTVAVGAAAQDCFPDPMGMVGWWPGDGSAKDIVSNNNGMLLGGATANAPGVVGSAFSFDGTNGYVQIPDSPAFHLPNLTVEAWVLFNSLDSPASGGAYPGEQYIVFKQNSRTTAFEGFFLGKGRVGGRDLFVFGVSSASGEAVELDSVATATTGAWFHVAGVRGSNYIQLYVNGQLDSQANVTFPQDYGTNDLFFGSSGQAYWDRKLNGLLAEVSLYNQALDADEVAGIYAAGSQGKCRTPTVLVQPPRQICYWGGSGSFTAVASGSPPSSYQWQKDGVAITGATASSLTLTNLQLTNTGSYMVWVTSAFGNATSAPASLGLKVADVAMARPRPFTQHGAGLKIAGVANQTYGIQVAANQQPMSSWTGLTNLTLTAPTNVWYDPAPVTSPMRFYRVVPGPIAIP
jgi:hypothetical protein